MFSNTTSAGTDAEPDPPPARKVIRVEQSHDEMDEADRRLSDLGCTPVFKREFGRWSCFSFALSISGLYATIMATFTYPLYAGGAASVVWSWLVGGVGALALAVSIAEISSAYPTSGGMYFTIKFLCPESYVPIVAWVDGWLNLLGSVAGTASAEYGCAQMLLSAVSIASGFKYEPTQVHTILAMAGICLAHGTINSMSTSWLNKISGSYAVVHIVVLLGAAIALLAVDQNKHTPEYVFTHLEPASGWEPPSFSFFFGCLSVAWIIANCDGVGHIAEETKNPSRVIPAAMTASAVFTYVAGFLFSIVLVFSLGDPKELLDSPTGMPVSQIFYNVMGPAPAVLFASAGFLIMNFVCISSIHAGSRTIWAFSRDEMLPLSRVWFRLHPKTKTPIPSVWLYVTLCVCVNLIGLGSHILITAIFNICAVALNWSYCIPIICKLLYPAKFDRGPWHLGKFSAAINIYAVLWNAFLSVIFMLPTMLPVTASNMNYAFVVLIVTLVLAIVYWYAGGRKHYTGPRVNFPLKNGDATSEETLAQDDPEKLGAVYLDSPASTSTVAFGNEDCDARGDVDGADRSPEPRMSESTVYGSDDEFIRKEEDDKEKIVFDNPFQTPNSGSTESFEHAEGRDVAAVTERDVSGCDKDRSG